MFVLANYPKEFNTTIRQALSEDSIKTTTQNPDLERLSLYE
jgi:hypothetical protein